MACSGPREDQFSLTPLCQSQFSHREQDSWHYLDLPVGFLGLQTIQKITSRSRQLHVILANLFTNTTVSTKALSVH
jgi:hypothetical protein